MLWTWKRLIREIRCGQPTMLLDWKCRYNRQLLTFACMMMNKTTKYKTSFFIYFNFIQSTVKYICNKNVFHRLSIAVSFFLMACTVLLGCYHIIRKNHFSLQWVRRKLLSIVCHCQWLIGSINWTDAMTHTQHELPPISDERNKLVFSGYMVTAQQFGTLCMNTCRNFGFAIVSIILTFLFTICNSW